MTGDRVIGRGGELPWHYPADLKRFKRLTLGSTIIMGRKTWESLPRRPLADRRNLVITSRAIDGVECFADLRTALASCSGQDVWFIGGARIFAEAMEYADQIDLTLVPDTIPTTGSTLFPVIDDAVWSGEDAVVHPDDDRLRLQVFRRRMLA